MNTETPILVIDDDRKYGALIQEYLETYGYEVSLAHNGVDGLHAARNGSFAAIILDVMMPGMDGFEVLRELRKTHSTPVLMLTARGEETDRIVGLEMGADDYLPKTFSTRELLARLRAVTRRHFTAPRASAPSDDPGQTQEVYTVGDLTLNVSSHTLKQNGIELDLTALEFCLMQSLIQSKGVVKSREQLLEDASDRHYTVFDRSIDVHISSLRKKLGDDASAPRYIRTVRAVGYQFIDRDSM